MERVEGNWACMDCGYTWTDDEDVGVCPACGSINVVPEDRYEPIATDGRGCLVAGAGLILIILLFALLLLLIWSR